MNEHEYKREIERRDELLAGADRDLSELRETVANLGRQVGGLPLLRTVVEERDEVRAERDQLKEQLEKALAELKDAARVLAIVRAKPLVMK